MRFVVLGAGAVGAFVGASLARGGQDVTLIARGPHLRAMQADGVRVITAAEEFVVRPVATDDLDALIDAEVILVALKANSVPALAPELGARLDRGATTIWAQNGIPWWYFQAEGGPLEGTVLESVDPGGVTSSSIDPASVVGCVVYCSTETVQPGVIRHLEGTRFSIGEPDGSISDRCRGIASAFQAGGLKAPVDAKLRSQIWLKLVGNVAFNPISALTGSTLGALGTSAEMRDLLRKVFEEVAAVASRLGISLPISLDRRLEAGIAIGDHKTSMLQDVAAKRPLEIDCLSGAVIELAAILGVEVPHVATIHACVKQLDRVLQGAVQRA